MQVYYDEDDYPLPTAIIPEMESQLIQSNYGNHNMILCYEYKVSHYLHKKDLRRKDLGDLIYSKGSASHIPYSDIDSCRIRGVKINMGRNTSVKIMSMSTDELLAEYGNLE